MKKLCLCITVLFSLSAALTGCSSAQPSGTQARATNSAGDQGAVIEPEQLISQNEAAQLLGEALEEGKKTDNAVVGQKLCVYEAKSADSFAMLQISLTQQAFMGNGNNTPESIYLATKDAVDETADERTVEGVGDEYFFGTPGLHIFFSGYYIVIAAGNSSDPEVQEVLAQAGKLACQNLDALLGH